MVSLDEIIQDDDFRSWRGGPSAFIQKRTMSRNVPLLLVNLCPQWHWPGGSRMGNRPVLALEHGGARSAERKP